MDKLTLLRLPERLCKSLYVCVQRFLSQDILPPEFQHLGLSGARLCPGLMVKLLL